MAKKVIGILILAALAFIACNDKPEGPSDGRLNVYLQDGMADYDSIKIVIDSAYIYTDVDSFVREPIRVSQTTPKISYLRNGRRMIYCQVDLMPQEINGIDMVFSGGLIYIDTMTYTMILPDNADYIHKLAPANLSIARGEHTNALVEIKLFDSIEYDSTNDIYTLDPSVILIDFDSTGSIIGRTTPKANIFLFEHDMTDTLNFTVSEGDTLRFEFCGLRPGWYDVLCRPIGEDTIFYDDLLNTNVPVVRREDYDMGLLDLPVRP